MYCAQCGTPISNSAKFCPTCGSSARADRDKAKPSANTAQAPSVAGGQPLTARTPAATARAVPEPGPRASGQALRRGLGVIAASGAVALVLAVGGYFTWSHMNRGSKDTTAAPVASPASPREMEEQAQIAAANAALDRAITTEENEARERASKPAPK